MDLVSPATPLSGKSVSGVSIKSTGSSGSSTLGTPLDAPVSKTKSKKGKTKVLYFWSSEDVNKWLRKHCGQYHQLYGDLFLKHEISGRTLVRLNDVKLLKIGITDTFHREELMRHILRLKLKTEQQELKTLEQRGGVSFERK